MAKPNAGSFSAYLEYKQRGESGNAAPAPSPASLLTILYRGQPEGTPMDELTDRSGMTASTFRESLKRLSDSGLVDISGQPLSELVKLTAKGLETATLF